MKILSALLGPLLTTTILFTPAIGAQTEDFKVVAGDPSFATYFGEGLDLDGSTLVVGAPRAAGDTPDSGAVYIFERIGCGAFSQVQKVTAGGGSDGDVFGSFVHLSDDILLVGAALNDDVAYNAGAAYVYERDGSGTFVFKQKLTASDGSTGDHFGDSLQRLGGTLCVGAGALGSANKGAVYVFEQVVPGTWTEVQKVVPTDLALLPNAARFGFSLSLSGNSMLVGAPRDHDPVTFAGSAYVFDRIAPGAPYTQTEKLTPGAGWTYVATSVALQGGTALLGAPSGVGPYNGAVHVYERDGLGSFQLLQTLQPPLPAGTTTARFGYKVDIEGSNLVGTAPSSPSGPGVGSAYSFRRRADGTFSLTGTLVGSTTAASDTFGYGLAMSEDLVVIGSPRDDDAAFNAGVAFGFSTLGLCGAPREISLATGGSTYLELDAGAPRAGQLYWVLGSLTGTSPGLVLGDHVLPLAVDFYTSATIQFANLLISNSAALLDGSGLATASFGLPAGFDPALAGVLLWHAYFALDFAGAGNFSFTSNAVPVRLVP